MYRRKGRQWGGGAGLFHRGWGGDISHPKPLDSPPHLYILCNASDYVHLEGGTKSKVGVLKVHCRTRGRRLQGGLSGNVWPLGDSWGGKRVGGAMQLCSFNCTSFPIQQTATGCPLGPKRGGGERQGETWHKYKAKRAWRWQCKRGSWGLRHRASALMSGRGVGASPPRPPRPSKGKAIPFLCQSLLHSPSRGRVPLRGLRLLEEAWQGPAPAKWPRCASGRPPGSLGAASAPSSCAGSGAGTA